MKITLQFGFLLVASAILLSPAKAANEPLGRIVGQVGLVDGDVLVDEKAVQKNSPVRQGSIIEVKNGKATLVLGTGSVFHLAANSKMVVNQFGVDPNTKKEGGDLDLRFGKTRGLIQNKGEEGKSVRIKARSATMGVRGTEVFISAPPEGQGPVQFFTLEGSAVVQTTAAAAPVPVNQNQGVGVSEGTTGSKSDAVGASSAAVQEVKNEIKASGMEVEAVKTPGDVKAKLERQYLSDRFGVNGSIPMIQFDPIQDRIVPVTIAPKFCNATGVANCP